MKCTRKYSSFDREKGYPTGKNVYYECTKCEGVVSSLPEQFTECECGNVSVDAVVGRFTVLDKSSFKIFESKSFSTEVSKCCSSEIAVLKLLNIPENSLSQHVDKNGNVYRIRVLNKGENLFFQENDKYVLCLIDAVHGIIDQDSVRKWEPSKRMSPLERERVIGLIEKYYRKVYGLDVKRYSSRDQKKELKALITKIGEVETELTQSEFQKEFVGIDLNNPDWEKVAEKRMTAFFDKFGVLVQDITTELMAFFIQSTPKQRTRLWKALSEAKLLNHSLFIDREEHGSSAWLKDRILLHILKDLEPDTRDVLMELDSLKKVAKEYSIDINVIIQEHLPLANTMNKHGMGSMRTILERIATSSVLG